MMRIGIVVFVLLSLSACVTAKTNTWSSRPSTQQVQNADFSAQLTPLKRDKEPFVSFRLFIENKTDQDLKIDWNQTRYLVNGKAYGPVCVSEHRSRNHQNIHSTRRYSSPRYFQQGSLSRQTGGLCPHAAGDSGWGGQRSLPRAPSEGKKTPLIWLSTGVTVR